MQLENLQLGKIVIHEVLKREGEAIPPPKYGAALENLDAVALAALRQRVLAAMQDTKRCIKMSVDHSDAGSMVQRAQVLADSDDPLFLAQSRGVADKLAASQLSRTIPGGIVIVFTGTHGAPAQRLVGIIKADVHNGFTRQTVNGVQSLQYLTDLLLTYQTKLYKVGLFVEADPAASELSSRWDAYIYDETLTAKNRYGAAKYFYEAFLGTVFPESSARSTKQFHDLTKEFITSMNVAPERKVELHNALVTYLWADQQPTVSVASFAEAYFDEAGVQDAYGAHMAAKDFPDEAIIKDLTDVDGSLKLRKLSFGNKVRITAPAEGFDDLVQITVIDAPASAAAPAKWTNVVIKDRILSSE